MRPEDLFQRVAPIEGFIRALTQECHILDERRHILAPLLQNADVQAALKRKIDKTTGARAWNHLAPLLGQDLLRDQARLFLDEDRRSGSLPNLWRKIHADPTIKAHFRDTYGHMFDELHDGQIGGLSAESSAVIMERFKKQDQEASYAQFDERWERLEADMAAIRSDPVAAKIKTFRDKRHSHFEMKKLGEEPEAFDVEAIGLTFNEVLSFGDRCQAHVADLGLLLTGMNWDPKEFAEEHARQGTAMWMTLAN